MPGTVERHGSHRMQVGPYAKVTYDKAGNCHVRLTDEGRELCDELLRRYDYRPIKALCKMRRLRWTFREALVMGMTKEEMNTICMEAAVDCVRRYDPARSDIGTSFPWSIIAEFRKHFRERKLKLVLASDYIPPSGCKEFHPYYGAASSVGDDDGADGSDDVELAFDRAKLTSREAKVVRSSFGLDGRGSHQSLTQIGEAMGFSRSRAQQLRDDALEKMRRTLSSDEFSPVMYRRCDKIVRALLGSPQSGVSDGELRLRSKVSWSDYRRTLQHLLDIGIVSHSKQKKPGGGSLRTVYWLTSRSAA